MAPELLAYHEDGRNRLGANVSRTIGQSIVAYAEWAGGREAVTSRAISFGQETGALPSQVVDPDPGQHFTNDAALGASWTSGIDKLTLNLEYHYHQAGFSGSDWRHWFAETKSGIPNINGVLWYVRGYAQDQMEPMTQQEVFLRADWTDAFVDDLELSAIAFVDAYDGSTMTQVSATYYLSGSLDRRRPGRRQRRQHPHRMGQHGATVSADAAHDALFLGESRIGSASHIPIEQENAAASLSDVDRVEKRTRELVRYSFAATYQLLWGVLVAVGYVAQYLHPLWGVYIWAAVIALGLFGGLAFRLQRARGTGRPPTTAGCGGKSRSSPSASCGPGCSPTPRHASSARCGPASSCSGW